MEFILYRYDYSLGHTAGILLVEGKYVADTLELPWKDNHKNISCIPEGRYEVNKFFSRIKGECILLKDVPDREGIEIHSGNRVSELKGCIAVGIKALNLVLSSRDKLNVILNKLGVNQGTLDIKRI